MTLPSFQYPPDQLNIQSGEIHVWTAVLHESADQLDRFSRIISNEEQIKAGRFRHNHDKNNFIVRRGILKSILGYYMDVEPQRVLFRYTEYGRPVLLDAFGKEEYHFSVSFSNGVALFAFSRREPIGVDIEFMHHVRDFQQIIEISFSLHEIEVMNSLPEAAKREMFFRGWACKEAIVKALGYGLSFPLDMVELSLIPDDQVKLLMINKNSAEASEWNIEYWEYIQNYACALAVRSHEYKVKHWRWRVI